MTNHLNRRGMIAGARRAGAGAGHAQAAKPQLGTPLSVITTPARDFGPGAPPPGSPDPDIIRVDPSFGTLLIGQAAIKRVSTGYHFLEGPAWSAVGLYAIFSDVKEDTLYRYLWETGQVLGDAPPVLLDQRQQFRFPGPPTVHPGLFPPRGALGVGRLDEHRGRCLMTASRSTRPMMSRPHKDGSVWFTDPLFGANLAEGHPDDGDGPTNPGACAIRASVIPGWA